MLKEVLEELERNEFEAPIDDPLKLALCTAIKQFDIITENIDAFHAFANIVVFGNTDYHHVAPLPPFVLFTALRILKVIATQYDYEWQVGPDVEKFIIESLRYYHCNKLPKSLDLNLEGLDDIKSDDQYCEQSILTAKEILRDKYNLEL